MMVGSFDGGEVELGRILKLVGRDEIAETSGGVGPVDRDVDFGGEGLEHVRDDLRFFQPDQRFSVVDAVPMRADRTA